MTITPWSYAQAGTEHSEQAALFMWANMATKYGHAIASDPERWTKASLTDLRNRAEAFPPDQWPAMPGLARLFAVHNQGHGDKVRGNRARAEGVKRGVPDLMLPVPRMARDLNPDHWGGFTKPFGEYPGALGGVVCGLFIELKVREITGPGVRKAEVIVRRAGETSEEQDDWLDYLRSTGYVGVVCEGWELARDVLVSYLT